MKNLKNRPKPLESTDYAPLSHASLFSGIGGFDLAAEWMGWENAFHCEWNEFGKRVLQYYWPNAKSYDDITKTDFKEWKGKIDILTAGFPCQPFSVAGQRKGTEDNRHLWPEMLRAIQEIQPSWVVGENVPGIISWSDGMVFEQVCSDLENEGYEAQPVILPAASVNAPHKRDRVWFVAHRSSERCNHGGNNRIYRQILSNQNWYATKNKSKRNRRKCGISETRKTGDAANTDSKRRRRLRDKEKKTRTQNSNELSEKQYRIPDENVVYSDRKRCEKLNASKEPTKQIEFTRSHVTKWQNFPTQPPVCDGNDGIPNGLSGITFSKWRNESIKALGNAIVPQLALQIFKTIQDYENKTNII